MGAFLLLPITVVLSYLLYKFACKFVDKNPFVALGIAAFGIFLIPVGIFVPIVIFSKLAKYSTVKMQERYAMMSALSQNPTDENVDALIATIDSQGGGVIPDDPNSWNTFRNLWFSVNASPRVTTAKKNHFRMWLTSKGLFLTEQQAAVIDNYQG